MFNVELAPDREYLASDYLVSCNLRRRQRNLNLEIIAGLMGNLKMHNRIPTGVSSSCARLTCADVGRRDRRAFARKGAG